ncbi:MAG TPA: hypothetical protein VME01_11305 [Solirubrobacteraceae bacterium]|nr:hypothetical protein [Solirubrobacteraceae bacterium]
MSQTTEIEASAPTIWSEVTFAEELAYTLLEEARLRCERLIAGDFDVNLMRRLHREVGFAGYCAGERLVAYDRRMLLELAREHAEDQREIDDELSIMVGVIAAGSHAVTRALSATANSEHVQQANVHLTAACELLEAECVMTGSL